MVTAAFGNRRLTRTILLVMAAVVFSFVFIALPENAFAAPGNVPDSTKDIKQQDLNKTIGNIIRKIVNFIATIAGVVLVGLLIKDGIKLAGSSGNPSARSEAITGIMYSLIGGLVALGAVILVGVIVGLL